MSTGEIVCAPADFNKHEFFDIVHFSGGSNDAFALAAKVALPEPASMIVLVGVGATLLARRRKRSV